MIKATISNQTKRNAFAKAGAKKIAGGHCETKVCVRGLVLNNYKVIASGMCSDKQKNNDFGKVILFSKQKEVA